MNCTNCNNPLPNEAKFCGKCGTKTLSEPSPMVGTVKDKTVRGTRTVLGIFLGLLTFAIAFKVIAFIVTILTILAFKTIDPLDVEAIANILGFILSAILANKVYKSITKKNIDPNTPAKKKKWYQFGGFA